MPARPRAFSERTRSSGRRGGRDQGGGSSGCGVRRITTAGTPRGIDPEPGALYGSRLQPERTTHAGRGLRAGEQRAHTQKLLGRPQQRVVAEAFGGPGGASGEGADDERGHETVAVEVGEAPLGVTAR